MKIKFLFPLILLLSFRSFAQTYNWPVSYVVDGDTVKVFIASLPDKLNPISVRILGIDTPEKGDKASCKKERELAEQATAFTQQAIGSAKKVEFINIQGWDKYHRILAEVMVDGKNLGTLLVQEGLAREYKGGKRASWCN